MFPDEDMNAKYEAEIARLNQRSLDAEKEHNFAGRDLFVRYRFFMLGVVVACLAFAASNRELDSASWFGLSTWRVAVVLWSVSFLFLLASVQVTIALIYFESKIQSRLSDIRIRWYDNAIRQNNHTMTKGAPSDTISQRLNELEDQDMEVSKSLQEEHEKLLRRPHQYVGFASGFLFLGAAFFISGIF